MIASPLLLFPLLTPTTPAMAWQEPEPRSGRPAAPYSLPPLSGESRDGRPVQSLVPAGAPAPRVAPAVHTDDTVPLPVPARMRETLQGDVVDVPAAGDPEFLGFAAGRHYPDAGELVAQEVYDAALALWTDGRPRLETYAFVMFSKRMTPERLAALESAGCRLLGFHPHYTQKVALSAEAIDRIAALDFVRWVGTPRRWQKLHPGLAASLDAASPNQPLELWISVFESDVHAGSRRRTVGGAESVDPEGRVVQEAPIELRDVWITDGWQSRALEALGVEVLEFAERVNAFRVRVLPPGLDLVTELDFVQFVERDLPVSPDHDESMPMVNLDDVRSFYDGGRNQRSIAGFADGGLETAHQDISIFGLGFNFTSNPNGPFQDDCGHGTHVAGTIVGKGNVEPGHRGAAPGLGFDSQHPFWVARIFSGCSFPQSVDDTALLAWQTSPQGASVGIPHVFNNSFGTGPGSPVWIGSELEPRLYDDAAYNEGQLNVNSMGNSGPGVGTVNRQATGKSVLAIGSVTDWKEFGPPPSIALSSSRGPCGDGRWKPSLVAPGRSVHSASYIDPTGYSKKSGTSMAAPHVVGLVADLIDKDASYAYLPERITSQLMATATRTGNTVLTNPGNVHLDDYGAGRIDGTKALWSGGDGTWTTWSASLASGSSTSGDFTVPSGATRLVAVMNYTEESASAGASKALVNDWDFYLDQPPLSSGNNTGEWSAQQSAVDNTEIRVLNNPLPGTWRWKIWPESTSSVTFFGVTVYVETGDTTPAMSPTMTASHTYAQPLEHVSIDYSLTTGDGAISSVFLEGSSTASGSLVAATTTLADGVVTDLRYNEQSGWDMNLGDVHPWFTRRARWTHYWYDEGVHDFCVRARSDNASNDASTQCVTVTIDGQPPGTPAPFSLTHFPSVWSGNAQVDFLWPLVQDNLSGVDGFAQTFTGAPGAPPPVANLPATALFHSALAGSSGSFWFNLAAVDKAGNWSPHASVGPFLIDLTNPSSVTNLQSSTHTVNVSSCSTTMQLTWDPATDADSGVAGYGVIVDLWATSPAPTTLTTTTASHTAALAGGAVDWYAHVRAIDAVGNLGPTTHLGPFPIDPTPVSTYCTSKVNSQGCTPTIGWSGIAPSMSAGSGFHVTSTSTLDNKSGLFFYGYTPKASIFQGGWLCVKAPVKRTALQNSGGSAPCGGLFTYDFNAHIATGIDPSLTAGLTVYGQYWSRDPQSSFNTNRTDAIQFTICP